LPYGERAISVLWRKTRSRCVEPSCARGSFTEAIEEVRAGRRTTGRLRRSIGSAVGDACRSVAEVANVHGVSWPTAHAAFVEHADALLAALEPTTVLGIDETRRGRPRWVRESVSGPWRRVDAYDTGFVDLAGAQGLLGQRAGRTSKTVVDWLEEQTPEFRRAILFVAIDPAAVYAKAVRTDGLLPNARLVVDHFHLVKLAKMWNTLTDADPSGQILAAWIAKEELRKLLALARTGPSRDQIAAQLHIFYDWCATTTIDELHTLAGTVETWWPEIEAFIDTGITNAKTEGLNRLIKQVKRAGCGFRNIDNQHRRVRFHCTRTHRAATAAPRSLPAQV
jgi:transposase